MEKLEGSKLEKMFAHPVGILLFNRPEYAERVIEGLLKQGTRVDQSKLVILRDGFPGSKYESMGEPDATAEIDRIVKRFLPEAQYIQEQTNIGIGLAIFALTERLFRFPNSAWATVFEEDFVPNPSYLEHLEELIAVLDPHSQVSIVSATGDTKTSRVRGQHSLYPMDHLWAFATRRSHWEAYRPSFVRFLLSQSQSPYWQRDYATTVLDAARQGMRLVGTSQDWHRRFFLLERGQIAITTGAKLGNYIGEKGLHYDSKLFQEMGFSRREFVEEFVIPEVNQELLLQVASEFRTQLALFSASVLKWSPDS